MESTIQKVVRYTKDNKIKWLDKSTHMPLSVFEAEIGPYIYTLRVYRLPVYSRPTTGTLMGKATGKEVLITKSPELLDLYYAIENQLLRATQLKKDREEELAQQEFNKLSQYLDLWTPEIEDTLDFEASSVGFSRGKV